MSSEGASVWLSEYEGSSATGESNGGSVSSTNEGGVGGAGGSGALSSVELNLSCDDTSSSNTASMAFKDACSACEFCLSSSFPLSDRSSSLLLSEWTSASTIVWGLENRRIEKC